MEEVTLTDMLDARERRAFLQSRLLKEYNLPLICFTLNIPGPVKVLPKVPQAYEQGCRLIKRALMEQAFPVVHLEEIKEKTGYEAFFCVDAPAIELKRMMVQLEDQDLLGRLFDIDVIQTNGFKISREETGGSGRRCLLCGRPAQECGRSRRHTVPELTARVQSILEERL